MQQHRAAPLHAFPPQLKAGHGPTIYSRADTAPPPWVCLQPHLTRPQSCPPRVPRSPSLPAKSISPSAAQQAGVVPAELLFSSQLQWSPVGANSPSPESSISGLSRKTQPHLH